MQAPVQTAPGGGFRLLDGDDYITQLIQVLVGDDESDNPFLELGLGVGAVFANLSDSGWRAQQIKKIQDVFSDLERAQIAKLRSIDFVNGSAEAEIVIAISYLSIETDTEQQARTTVRRR